MREMTDDTLNNYPADPVRDLGCWRRSEDDSTPSPLCEGRVEDHKIGLCAAHLHEMRNSKP